MKRSFEINEIHFIDKESIMESKVTNRLAATSVDDFHCVHKQLAHIEREDWADDVKQAINDFIDLYGDHTGKREKHPYAVFDFDNTTSIFDMAEQLMMYQAEVMAYSFCPDEMPRMLAAGLEDLHSDLSDFGYGKGCYQDWIEDITKAYSYLYMKYGPFQAVGLNDVMSELVQKDPMWNEFVTKMMILFWLISDKESTTVSYPWAAYWFTGMTEEEVYLLAKASHAKYRQVNTSIKTISTPAEVGSLVGPLQYTYVEGVQVTENMRELWQKLNEAGIDVWVCSASESNIIRAAIDEFGLHDYCTGLIGMTPKKQNGKFCFCYDYESGYAWYPTENGSWNRGNRTSGAQTQGYGKVVSIQNICKEKYGYGPTAGFMDSTGDYNFCTEFFDLKLVVCFNRATSKVTDGGSIIAELAMYQREELHYSLQSANGAGDTMYVLQGRDENEKRTFRNSNKTIKAGETREKLYRDQYNEIIYSYIVKNQMTTKDVINAFALKTEEKNPENKLGFQFGFLNSYDGYHSK